jgi:hypothetical protein
MKRDPLRPILDVAVAHAVSYTRLSTEEVVASRRRWRETFAQGVFAATGEWRHLGFDWHAFSYEHLPALEGELALAEYRRQSVRDVHVLPDGQTAPDEGIRASFEEPPDFGRRDVLVFPPSCAWTMAFTHEAGWLGPYFAKARAPSRPRRR